MCGGAGSCTLEIELLSFGVNYSKNDAIINWTTGSEIDNDYFIIEKSTDGSLFTSIAKVAGVGNSFSSIEYQFKELNGISNHDTYYRIVDVDYEGVHTTSNVFVLKAESVLNRYAIHKSKEGKIIVSGLQGPGSSIYLYDVFGGLKEQAELGSPDTGLQLSESYMPGIYLVVIRDTSGTVKYSSKLMM